MNRFEQAQKRANEAQEDFVNEVEWQYGEGYLSTTAARVASGIAPLFFWDKITDHGAPLYLTHAEVIEHVHFSRGTLYGARAELISAGLIKVIGKTWHAAVGVLHV